MKKQSAKIKILAALALAMQLVAASAVQFDYTDQYEYVNNGDGTCRLIDYFGPGGYVEIPATLNGLAVTTINKWAFFSRQEITSVSIPDTVIEIGELAFGEMWNLESIYIPEGVKVIGDAALFACFSLTNIVIPDSVTSIGGQEFAYDYSLRTATLGTGITHTAWMVFAYCTSLEAIYFRGDAPPVDDGNFLETYATVYHLPWTTGWGPTLAGLPTAVWNPIDDLIAQVDSQPLRATLAAAKAASERGNLKAAANQLRAFQNKVKDQALIEAAQQVIQSL